MIIILIMIMNFIMIIIIYDDVFEDDNDKNKPHYIIVDVFSTALVFRTMSIRRQI